MEIIKTIATLAGIVACLCFMPVVSENLGLDKKDEVVAPVEVTSATVPEEQKTSSSVAEVSPVQSGTTVVEAEETSVASPTPEIIFDGVYKRWNEALGCYDESNLPTFEATERDSSLTYDPNWLVENVKADGCKFYMVPNQGHDNGPAEAGEK
jgi:hypothetical protein